MGGLRATCASTSPSSSSKYLHSHARRDFEVFAMAHGMGGEMPIMHRRAYGVCFDMHQQASADVSSRRWMSLSHS